MNRNDWLFLTSFFTFVLLFITFLFFPLSPNGDTLSLPSLLSLIATALSAVNLSILMSME